MASTQPCLKSLSPTLICRPHCRSTKLPPCLRCFLPPGRSFRRNQQKKSSISTLQTRQHWTVCMELGRRWPDGSFYTGNDLAVSSVKSNSTKYGDWTLQL